MNREKIIVTKESYDQLREKKGLKLLYDPNAYVKEAIRVLECQLQNAQTVKRQNLLKARIADWKAELTILEELDNEQKNKQQESTSQESNES